MKSLITSSAERYNLSPMAYPWAFERYTLARKNFWEPGEVNMGQDLAHYRALREAERETFLDVFATLTTADLVVQENLVLNIYGALDVPEIRLFLGHQIADESLHSRSYQHVIDVLSLGDDTIYRRYLTKPEIGQKFGLANRWGVMIRSADPVQRYYGLAGYYAGFEGIWFYHGFTPILSLLRRNPPQMPGTCEQLQYIARDETTHFGFGIELLNAMADEIGRDKISERAVQQVFRDLIAAEEIYAAACIRPMLGYNEGMHLAQARWLANLRLTQLGWSGCFEKAEAWQAVPWLGEVLQVRKEKNFFETRVTEYRTGAGLNFDGVGSGMPESVV